jgi:hypothetical protein
MLTPGQKFVRWLTSNVANAEEFDCPVGRWKGILRNPAGLPLCKASAEFERSLRGRFRRADRLNLINREMQWGSSALVYETPLVCWNCVSFIFPTGCRLWSLLGSKNHLSAVLILLRKIMYHLGNYPIISQPGEVWSQYYIICYFLTLDILIGCRTLQDPNDVNRSTLPPKCSTFHRNC